MKPISARARNYGPYRELDISFAEGCTVILGEIRGGPPGVDSNGAGKSHVLNAIPHALYGPGSGLKLADLLTNDGAATEMTIEFTFERRDSVYRVRRSFSAKGSGKTTLDLEQLPDGLTDEDDSGWEPLTASSLKETQAAIERLLGFTRDTFLASSLMVQDHPSFANPRVKLEERSQLLEDALGLDEWDDYDALASRDKRAYTKRLDELAGRARLLEENAVDQVDLTGRRDFTEHAIADAEVALTTAEQATEQAQKAVTQAHERAAERYRAEMHVKSARADLDAKKQIANRAESADIVIRDTAHLIEQTEPIAAGLEAAEKALSEARAAYFEQVKEEQARGQKRGEAERRTAALERRAADRAVLVAKSEALAREILALEDQAQPVCRECGQEVRGAHLEQTKQRIGLEVRETRQQAAQIDQGIADETAAIAVLIAEAGEPLTVAIDATEVAELDGQVRVVTGAATKLAALRERLATAKAQAAEYTATVAADIARLTQEHVEAEKALAAFADDEPANVPALEARVAQARQQTTTARTLLDTHRSELARITAALEQAARNEQALAEVAAEQASVQAELDLATAMCRVYGRDGGPALIIENIAAPYIEAEATRILDRLGTGYQVELRTEKANKTNANVRAALDVVVVKENGVEQPYALFSGGEESRIGLALRIALARLLKHRRGADSQLLAIDEPRYLDSAGMAALVELMHELTGEFPVQLLVSHIPELRESFDQVIQVVKEDGRSRIVGAPVEAQAVLA